MDILKFLAALVTLIAQGYDFAVKAFAAYAQTPAGAKEWLDVENALREIGALPADEPTATAQTVPGWVMSPAEFNPEGEQVSGDASPSPPTEPRPASVRGAGLPTIRRMPNAAKGETP